MYKYKYPKHKYKYKYKYLICTVSTCQVCKQVQTDANTLSTPLVIWSNVVHILTSLYVQTALLNSEQ